MLFEPTHFFGESDFVCGIKAFNGLKKQIRGHPPAWAGSNNKWESGIVGFFHFKKVIRMEDFLSRTRLLFGEDKVKKLQKSKIVLLGLGGVGSYALEALVRSGIEDFILVDYDTLNISNLNRQLIALRDNLGDYKVDAAEKRMRLINPDVKVKKYKEKLMEGNLSPFIPLDSDYVIDAIDDIDGKIAIIKYCLQNNLKIISSMGTGNRFTFKDYMIDDIGKSHGCPLARKLRKKLKEEGIYKGVEVLFSASPADISVNDSNIASVAYVPGQAGLKLAERVINHIINT